MFKAENNLKLTNSERENVFVDVHFDRETKKLYVIAEHMLNDTLPRGIYLYAVLKFDFKTKEQDISDFVLYKPMKDFNDAAELAEAVSESTNMFARMRAELREIAYQEALCSLAEYV